MSSFALILPMNSRPQHTTGTNDGSPELSLKFERIFQSTKDRLYHFVWKLTRDPVLAKDMIQECYLKLWQQIGSIHTEEEILPLLYTYARHAVIDHLRKLATRQTFLQQWEQQQVSSQITDQSEEEHLTYKERLHQLQHSIELLPAKRKQIFTLVKQEGLSHKAVAERLQITTATVEKQISLSLKFLRKSMDQ